MNSNPLKHLGRLGQSIWLDYIRRDLIVSGAASAQFLDGRMARELMRNRHTKDENQP